MAATSCAQAPKGSQDYLGRKPTDIPVSGSGTVPRSPGRGLRHSEVEEVDCSVEDRDVEPGSAVTLPDVPATRHGVLPVPGRLLSQMPWELCASARLVVSGPQTHLQKTLLPPSCPDQGVRAENTLHRSEPSRPRSRPLVLNQG